ncbi:hybrid sensor histidine kinase/response regulator transcription factor [Polaribacter atrinae]|uniref:histidine kinase n=1 Tax=Polaribacter atrinae TaxID=1333662 RepID=A0A176TGC1_9FLAO|nr:ATP-binding protein [Polaribacter atrinae]OAD46446.1 hypothetical protein LPB303_02635 [Polaribacter atrinae]
MPLYRNSLILLLISLFFNYYSYAQFINYSSKDGLSVHSVDHITEDDEGYIYIATAEGFDVFNGNTFKNYNQNNTIGFSNNIRIILPLKKGLILIGSRHKGLYLFNKYKQVIVPLLLRTNVSIKSLNISALFVDKNDVVWVGCGDGTLYNFSSSEIKEDIITSTKVNTTKIAKLSGSIEAILALGNSIFVGGDDSFVTRIRKTETNYIIDNPIELTSVKTIYCIATYNNMLFLGTNVGLFKVPDYNQLNYNTLQTLKVPWKLNEQIIRTLSIHNQTLWAGTEGNGLYNYDINSKLLEQFNYSENKRNSLHSNYILHSYIDSRNNLWLGTWFGGIDLLNLNETNYTFVYDQTDEKNLFSNIVWAIEELPKDRFILGTHGNGLCQYNINDKSFVSIINNDELKSISSLCYDPISKLLYIGTWGHGIKIFDTTLNKLIKEDPAFNLLQNQRIYSMTLGFNGQLWIGSWRKGVFRYYINEKRIENIQSTTDVSLNNTGARSIILDENKNEAWIGSLTQGIYHLKLDSSSNIKELKHYQEFTDTKQKISVRNLFLDKTGDLWILCERGIGKIKLGKQPETLPLLNTGINSVLARDNKNNIWVGSYNGLFSFQNNTDDVSLSITNNTIYDLLNLTKSNLLLAASNNGLIKVDLNRLPESTKVPKITLSNLKIMDQYLTPDLPIKNKVVLSKKLNYNDTIVLPYFSQTFSIDLNALSFNKNRKVKLRYKLNKFESIWNETNSISTTASYTNVPAGIYELNIQVANQEYIWSTDVKKLTIIKLKPWWATHFAYFLYFLISSIIIYWVSNILLNKARISRELRVQKFEKEQEHEMHQQKMSFFTNISHDIRTPLTLILSPLEEILSSGKADEQMRIKLQRMFKNARMLLNLINQILDFRKVETINLALNIKQIKIKDFIQSVYYQFNELSQNKSIDLEVFCSYENLLLAADPVKLESILFNLLANAIKFTPKYGHIMIFVSNNDDIISIGIKDTGIGIPENEIESIFTRFQQSKRNTPLQGTGIGLALVKKYVEAHKGTIEVKSQVNKGTEFIIHFPVLEELNQYDSHLIYNDTEATHITNPPEEIVENSSKIASVLVIDDNNDIRDYLKEILEKKYRVYTAENGKEGLSIVHKKMPNLVISDIMMEGVSGYDVCKQIKTNINTSHIPVILLTAKNTIDDKIEGFEKGSDAFIEKPFNNKLLLTRVKALIEERDILKRKFLLADTVSKDTIPTTVDKQFIEKIISKIEAHISESEFSVQSLTESVQMSQDQLYRKIKALTGLSINHFIRLIRIKKSARLLSEGNHTVSEILYMVGFNNPSYFTKCFKAEYGVLPSNYRELQEEKPK